MTRTLPSLSAPESRLHAGWFIYWETQVYKILPRESDDPFEIQLVNVETWEKRSASYEELVLEQDDQAAPIFAPSREKLQAEIDQRTPSPIKLPETLPVYTYVLADNALGKVKTVDDIVAEKERLATLAGQPFKRTPAIQAACDALDEPIALATYYKYKKLIELSNGDRTRFAASFRRSSYNRWKVTSQQLHFIDTIIARYYLRKDRPRPSTVYKFAQAHLQHTHGYWVDPTKCRRGVPRDLASELLDRKIAIEAILVNDEKARLLSKIKLPSKSWLYPYLQWFRAQPNLGKKVIQDRLGKAAWEEEHLIFDTFINRAQYPLQYVFADHWLIDLFIVDEETRTKVIRLWWTVLIDAYTRCIVGMALLDETPCIESIQSALRHAIWPKTSHTALGIAGEWLCNGIPLRLFLDNAWAHHSHSLERLARAISQNGTFSAIELDFRPPYKGRYGSIIESLFGHISADVKETFAEHGALQSSDPKDVRNAAQQACLLSRDVDEGLHKKVLDYHHTPHRGLNGVTPHQKWLEGLQAGPPLVPAYTPNVERLFWRMSSQTRAITQHGVGAFAFHYSAPELTYAEKVGKDGKPIRFNYSYEPSNISRSALFRDDQWVCDVWAKELKLADNTYLPFSIRELSIAKKLTRDDGKTLADILSYRDQIQERARTRRAEQRHIQRQQPESPRRSKKPLPSAEDVQASQAAMETATLENQELTNLLQSFGRQEAA